MSGIALLAALLYFAAYVPFTYLSGRYKDIPALSAIAVVLCMCGIWTACGYWGRIRLTRYTIVSGLCTAGIIGTTLAALSYKGVSVFTVALITRGAVLLLAPASDIITGNTIRLRSVSASALSIAALVVMNMHKYNADAPQMPGDLILILCGYVVCYAIKLPIFSAPKRGGDARGFLISEQTVAVAVYTSVTLYQYGLPQLLSMPQIAIGICSQLTGISGGAILISKQEHTATVPLNRAGSLTAGLIGSLLLKQDITDGQWIGFFLLLLAVAILAVPVKKEMRTCNNT